jgi:hypothetical protein
VLARIHPAPLTPQPLAVHELRAGQLHAEPGPGEALDRLTVEGLRGVAIAQERPQARLDSGAQFVPLARGRSVSV